MFTTYQLVQDLFHPHYETMVIFHGNSTLSAFRKPLPNCGPEQRTVKMVDLPMAIFIKNNITMEFRRYPAW